MWSVVMFFLIPIACYLLLCLLVVVRSDVVGSYVLSYSYRLLLVFLLASNVVGGAEFCSSSGTEWSGVMWSVVMFFLIPIACYLLLCLLVVVRSDVVGSYVLSYSYRLLFAFMLASCGTE
jgi:hypothetical protein